LAEGKGYNQEATGEILIESHVSGRANELMGESASVTLLDNEGNPYEVEKYQVDYDTVMRKASKLTEMRPEFHYTRNFYENAILEQYTGPKFDQAKVEELVQKYTELRLQDCLLNSELSKEVKTGNNGHIFLKVLREHIADELKLSEPSKASDYSFFKIFKDPSITTDVEGRYNTNDVSNL
jgi:hypothetical protein